MHDDRKHAIEQAIAQAEAQGEAWTNQTIFRAVGGNYAALAEYLKERRRTTSEAAAVAVLEADPPWPEPPEPPPPEPPLPPAAEASPLLVARQERDDTARHEAELAARHTTLKRDVQRLEIAKHGQRTDAGDLARRREVHALTQQRAQVEQERAAALAQVAQATSAKLRAADQFDALDGQARCWLKRLREGQRQARTLRDGWARGEAAEEGATAQAHLAELIGPTEAQALAADPRRRPSWLPD
jgi:hypothetical protein